MSFSLVANISTYAIRKKNMICKQYKKQKEWYADSETICNYLKQHKTVKGYLSNIEFVLDIPYRTLSQCCAGYRKIPLKYVKPLKEYLKL